MCDLTKSPSLVRFRVDAVSAIGNPSKSSNRALKTSKYLDAGIVHEPIQLATVWAFVLPQHLCAKPQVQKLHGLAPNYTSAKPFVSSVFSPL